LICPFLVAKKNNHLQPCGKGHWQRHVALNF
jgi:hypothetical protein